MALIFFDGFEDYSTDFPVDLRYVPASSSSFASSATYQSTGRFSDSKSLRISPSSVVARTDIAYALPAALTSAAIGISCKMTSLIDPTTTAMYNGNGLFFNDGVGVTSSSSTSLRVVVDSLGRVVVYRGMSTVLGMSAAVVTSGAWFHLGVEVVRHASAGSVTVYIDGVSVLSITGANTGSSSIVSVNLCTVQSTAADVFYDDFYVCDTNAWFGECRSSPLVLTGDTAQKDFTPSVGVNNYACIDELPPNAGDYVSANTVGAKDRYTVTDLSYTPTAIIGVKVATLASKDDITTRTIRNNVKSGSTNANGATKALSNSNKFLDDVFLTDPNTSAAWTKSGVDAVEVGFEVVA